MRPFIKILVAKAVIRVVFNYLVGEGVWRVFLPLLPWAAIAAIILIGGRVWLASR